MSEPTIGNLFIQYEALAETEDAKKRRSYRRDVNEMPTSITLGDAMYQSVGNKIGMKSEGHLRTHFDMASVHFMKSGHFRGMSREGIESRVAKALEYVLLALPLCESPIEKMILPWLIMEDYGPRIEITPVPVFIADGKSLPPQGGIFIVPQFQFLKYRMDLAVVAVIKKNMHMVVLECDGDGFHDNRDKDVKRDGFLASFCIRTIRASGKEIVHRPRDVSVRVAEALQELMEG